MRHSRNVTQTLGQLANISVCTFFSDRASLDGLVPLRENISHYDVCFSPNIRLHLNVVVGKDI